MTWMTCWQRIWTTPLFFTKTDRTGGIELPCQSITVYASTSTRFVIDLRNPLTGWIWRWDEGWTWQPHTWLIFSGTRNISITMSSIKIEMATSILVIRMLFIGSTDWRMTAWTCTPIKSSWNRPRTSSPSTTIYSSQSSSTSGSELFLQFVYLHLLRLH